MEKHQVEDAELLYGLYCNWIRLLNQPEHHTIEEANEAKRRYESAKALVMQRHSSFVCWWEQLEN